MKTPPEARTRRTTLRLWRRNPLRRHSDISEAWILLAAGLLMVAGGLLTGLVTQAVVERNLDRSGQRSGSNDLRATSLVDAVRAALAELVEAAPLPRLEEARS